MLSTTSYAILGMLAVRPWSAYELTKQMRRSLAYCWPKAESVLYDEPKRLVRLGLAATREEPANGARSRTVYEITAQGRMALQQWLATKPAPPRFEIESLLRLLYADHGSTADLLQALEAAREWAREQTEQALAQLEDYQRSGGPFPDRLHLIILFADLYARLITAVEQWATCVTAEVAHWPQTRGLGATSTTTERLDQLVNQARELLARCD